LLPVQEENKQANKVEEKVLVEFTRSDQKPFKKSRFLTKKSIGLFLTNSESEQIMIRKITEEYYEARPKKP
jgi:hypothetical protein